MATEVQSLVRGLSLLEVLASLDGNGAALAEIASRAGLSPSTTHRLLSTLVEAGYVTRAQDKHSYVLGHRIMGVAASLQHRTAHLRAVSRPHLEAIAAESGETANLVALDGLQSVYVDQVEGSRVVRMSVRVGSTFPANTSASAKAILAFRPAEGALKLIFGENQARRHTKRTIVNPEAFRAELAETRERGYAIEREELEEGVSCIAAPIRGRDGIAIAAISVPGPTARILQPTPDRLGLLVKEHASKISAAFVDFKKAS